MPDQDETIPLGGRLITALDSKKIGEGNFQTLKNMRYGMKSPKSVTGMTKINTEGNIFYKDIPFLTGMLAIHMIVDSGTLYMVGSRYGGVSTPYILCISKYTISGTTLNFLARADHDPSAYVQNYYTCSIYGDYLYISGYIYLDGVSKSVIRKINKNTLEVVWTYTSHIVVGGNISYSMVSPKLYNGAVYWGNWIGSAGGETVKLNDGDGSEIWKIQTQECFEVEIASTTHVDFIGDAGGVRRISRRLQTTGAETSTLTSGNYWFQKSFSDADKYWLASYFLIGSDQQSTLTKVSKSTLTVDWDANFNFRPAGNLELLRNVVTDGSDFYCLGQAFVTPVYYATFGKVNSGGTPGASLQHSTLTGFAAILVTADYVFVALYDNNALSIRKGYFECRSKTDFSLISSTEI